jgi:pyridoxamine 5'-phosphate oxidase
MPLTPQLLPDLAGIDPLALTAAWLAEATRRADQPNPDAMVLATVDGAGQPSARVVLCKGIETRPGYVRFVTNYLSRKGRELAGSPRAALVFHWDHLHRQVRIEGLVVKAPAAESDAYFASRPWQSRVGAWASAQSEPVASRAVLEGAVRTAAARFGTPVPGSEDYAAGTQYAIPRPPHWGAFHLWVAAIELWVEGDARIHDRARWERPLGAAAAGGEAQVGGPWSFSRLQP